MPAEPGDGAVLALDAEDAAHGRGGLPGGEDTGQDQVLRAGRGDAAAARGSLGLVAYATKLLPISGLRACSARRVASGFFMMSQTSSLWYARTGSALSLSTPNAHFSHQ
jgi:hypothetical protein